MLYDYQCKKCGSETEAVNKIADRHTNAPMCCDTHMGMIIKQAPMGFVDREINYKCPVTNQPVTSRKARNEIMARNNLIDANDLGSSHGQRRAAKAKHLAGLEPPPPKELVETMQREFAKEHAKI